MIKNLDNQEALEKLKTLAESIRICMFATVDENSDIFSRPMSTVKIDEEGNIWFVSNEYSEKVQDISKENQVYLFYSHPGINSYLQVKGNCSIVDDKNKIRELWTPAMKAWFPDGVDDPKICLLRVYPTEASYWDGPSSKLVVLFKMLKAAALGEKAQLGNTGSLNM
jgi:general stress protein 26